MTTAEEIYTTYVELVDRLQVACDEASHITEINDYLHVDFADKSTLVIQKDFLLFYCICP